MKRHEKLDLVLKYFVNDDMIPKNPMEICDNAGLEVDKVEAIKILDFLAAEGNADFIMSESNGRINKLDRYYYGNYKGIILLDNGGYKLTFYEYRRKKIANKISEYVDIIVKPLGILTAFSVIIWTITQIVNFYQK